MIWILWAKLRGEWRLMGQERCGYPDSEQCSPLHYTALACLDAGAETQWGLVASYEGRNERQ